MSTKTVSPSHQIQNIFQNPQNITKDAQMSTPDNITSTDIPQALSPPLIIKNKGGKEHRNEESCDQEETLVAVGLVQPVHVRLDTSTRHLRRIGRCPIEKLRIASKKDYRVVDINERTKRLLRRTDAQNVELANSLIHPVNLEAPPKAKSIHKPLSG